jgi:alkaline phosphatase
VEKLDYPARKLVPTRQIFSIAMIETESMRYRFFMLLLGCVAIDSTHDFDHVAIAQEPASARTVKHVSSDNDFIAKMQQNAIESKFASWGYWGWKPNEYSNWTSHSNRLIPVYTFNCSMQDYTGINSAYRSESKIRDIYHRVPENTLNPVAEYADQTDVYRLQRDLANEGYNRIILIVFDGMDWQTTWIAASYANGGVKYTDGRGTGLVFQDYRGTNTEFSYVVTSPYDVGGDVDVNAQIRLNTARLDQGGYWSNLGGDAPWKIPADPTYLIDKSRAALHAVTDSSSSATSLTTGIKTFNGAVNVDEKCRAVETIAYQLRRDKGFAIGAISSVPISHATPAAAFAHNVSRDDYQDLTRDLLGLPSVSCRTDPSPGLDVLIGSGWGVVREIDEDHSQGANFVPGNKFLTDEDLALITSRKDDSYIAALRTPGRSGVEVLNDGVQEAIKNKKKFLGFFGTKYEHLPFQTANGDFKPVADASAAEVYTEADLLENPTVAQMAVAGLNALSARGERFWALIEAGDVDWANHKNNVDNSIGAVLSGDNMVETVFQWIESHGGWDKTAVIVTADHGHYFNVVDIGAFTRPNQE